MEGTVLNTAFCHHCDKQVLIAQDLDIHERLIEVCVHCSAPIEYDAERARFGGIKLRHLGYEIDGEGPDAGGCGTGEGGGCSSCGSCG